jgi:IclR family acetate operon transcriptional repressor
VERSSNTLANSNAILNYLARVGAAPPSEIARVIAVHRTTVYRLIEGLNAVQMTQIDSDGLVSLHPKWLIRGDAAQSSMHEWDWLRERLHLVAESTGQTAFISIPAQGGALCTDWVQGDRVEVVLRPGRQFPYHVGAAGRIAFAYAAADAHRAYQSNEPFAKLTERTITSYEALEADARQIRDRGWAHSDEDVADGLGAIGFPVFNGDSTLQGCLSISGLANEIKDNLTEYLGIISEYAARPVPERVGPR